MAYTRGAASASQSARTAMERERAEVERLYAEGRALAQTAKQLRQRNANIEAKLTEERDRLEDRRADLTATLADLERAQMDADAAIRDAEERAALIRELAFDQARVLAERAYATGYSRGKDHARAKHATIQRIMPGLPRQAPQKGITTNSTSGVTTRPQRSA
jgi:predicted  nucleic acid-binding Zn-ribbon protein